MACMALSPARNHIGKRADAQQPGARCAAKHDVAKVQQRAPVSHVVFMASFAKRNRNALGHSQQGIHLARRQVGLPGSQRIGPVVAERFARRIAQVGARTNGGTRPLRRPGSLPRDPEHGNCQHPRPRSCWRW